MPNQRFNTPVKIIMKLPILAKIIEMEKEPGNQIGSFFNSFGQSLKVRTNCGEDSFVGKKDGSGSCFRNYNNIGNFCLGSSFDLCFRLAPFVLLGIYFIISSNLDPH